MQLRHTPAVIFFVSMLFLLTGCDNADDTSFNPLAHTTWVAVAEGEQYLYSKKRREEYNYSYANECWEHTDSDEYGVKGDSLFFILLDGSSTTPRHFSISGDTLKINNIVDDDGIPYAYSYYFRSDFDTTTVELCDNDDTAHNKPIHILSVSW